MNTQTLSVPRGMGWIPDLPSVKDYTLMTKGVPAAHSVSLGELPAGADLREHMPPVEDQGPLGSCTAHAAVALVEYMQRRATGKHIDASRLFVYYATRYLLGWISEGDTGAYLRSTMGALALFGAPPERYWPYTADERKFNKPPDSACYALGQSFQALTYFRLDENGVHGEALLQRIYGQLAKGFPVMFGFTVYDEFMEPASRDDHPFGDSFVKFPAKNSTEQGGHAIVACGYDQPGGALLIRNSWGDGWGDFGYSWMDARYVTEGLADDFWVVTKQEWVNTRAFAQ